VWGNRTESGGGISEAPGETGTCGTARLGPRSYQELAIDIGVRS
jgi:hypothetical protein